MGCPHRALFQPGKECLLSGTTLTLLFTLDFNVNNHPVLFTNLA